ncbi:MAG: transglycosylase domain-containing protein [Thermostichales cyanobacterium BF4_bins_65]
MPTHPLVLQLTIPGSPTVFYPLGDGETRIGRSREHCQIYLDSEVVSRIHALVKPTRPLPLWQRLRRWLGWPSARYQLWDQDSANGIYQGSRRVRRVALHHGVRLSLGSPGHGESVEIRVLDPPGVGVYVRRGLSGLLAAGMLWGLVRLGREWQQIPDLADLPRGPVVAVAADQRTMLRRSWSDAPVALGRLEDFGLLPQVLVGAEDRRFYSHWGVDLIGIARALWVNVTGGQIRQGGSTISQQLARTILRDYTGEDASLGRKWREALAALKLEWQYSKEEILLLYLNHVYLGNGISGFATASQFYFGKPPHQLDLAEAALLVGLLPGPNAFNPLVDPELSIRQRNRVLEQLDRDPHFRDAELAAARQQKMVFNPQMRTIPTTLAPYYYATVLHELEQILGAELARQGNFFIETYLDPRLQRLAEQTLQSSLAEFGSRVGVQQGAIVTLDSQTGAVLALVGGTDYRRSQFNRVIQAQRQPGSTFKIVPYALALERGIPMGRTYSCQPLVWQSFFRGCRTATAEMSLAAGLVYSENVIALRLAQDLGLAGVVHMAERLGIESPVPPYPAAILGTSEVTMLELTRAFATLASGGSRLQPRTIQRIYDTADPRRCSDPQEPRTCPELYSSRDQPLRGEQVISPQTAQQLTQILQEAVARGTGRAAYLGMGEAGKTGTTTGNKDLWFVGYLPQPAWVTTVWLGNDDSSPTHGTSGHAALIWGRYMRLALSSRS